MTENPPLRPATLEETAQSLEFALCFSGRKRVHDADRFAAAIVAKRLAEHLEISGFVLMKKPPAGDTGSIGKRSSADDRNAI